MSLLRLAPEGLFPIPSVPEGKTTLGFSLAGTIQGEGLLAGTPSLFLRLSGCNMACQWIAPSGERLACDTPHALQTQKSCLVASGVLVEKIAVHRGNINHLVVTGGEPLLQAGALVEFFEQLRRLTPPMHVTVESNGSCFAPALLPYVDLWSFSPKLFPCFLPRYLLSEGEYPAVINQWLAALPSSLGVQLKFVIGQRTDEGALLRFLDPLCLRATDTVMLMPLGATPEALAQTTPLTLELCLRHGFRFAPRLQILLWGNRVGV